MLRCVATCWVLLAPVWPFSNLSQKHPEGRNRVVKRAQHVTPSIVFVLCLNISRSPIAIYFSLVLTHFSLVLMHVQSQCWNGKPQDYVHICLMKDPHLTSLTFAYQCARKRESDRAKKKIKRLLERLVCHSILVQELITRSVQLPYIPLTVFSQTDLFLVWFRSPQEPQWLIAITSTD